jgi:hypothetical protein
MKNFCLHIIQLIGEKSFNFLKTGIFNKDKNSRDIKQLPSLQLKGIFIVIKFNVLSEKSFQNLENQYSMLQICNILISTFT